jgi:protein O-mannosyl-transferase
MEPQTITSREFLAHFCDEHRDDKRFCFILGAGASKKSGIPTGAELASMWCDYLKKEHEDEWLKSWFETEGIDGDKLAEYYPKIYKKRYEYDSKDGYAFLEKLMDGEDRVSPSYGYAVLAWILTREGRKNNIVITTNFDSLTEDALFIYTKKKPLIVGHEALAHFIKPNSSRPLIIKIHRDILFSPKNSEGELDDLPSAFVEGLHSILKQATPIIIGYGGNDGTLMGLLEKIEPLDGGMFWCRRETDSPPCRRIQEVVSKHNGRFVTVTGFDELMTQLGNRLGIPRQDGEVEQIASRRATAYREQLNKLLSTSDQQDSETKSAVSNIVERSEKKDWWYYDQLANKQKTLEDKNAVYIAGIEQLSDSPELIGNYAFFLEREKIDMVEAEKYYLMALKVNPNFINIICNYAIFLWQKKKDINEAEKYFNRAAAVDPDDADYLNSYAIFFMERTKRYSSCRGVFPESTESGFKSCKYFC